MRKLMPILLSCIFILMSCSDDDNSGRKPNPGTDPGTDPGKENPYKTGKDLSKSTYTEWANTGMDDSYFMLGYGYDATGKYAHPSSVRGKVVNLDKFAEDYSGGIVMMRSSSAEARVTFDGNKQKCITDMASRAGFSATEVKQYKNLFRETFTSAFKNDTSFPDLNYNYTGMSKWITTYHSYFMFAERHFLTDKYLTEDFVSDMQALPAEDIIVKYGTHALAAILVGHRIDYIYRCTPTDDAWGMYNWFSYSEDHYFKLGQTTQANIPEEDRPLKENMYVEYVDGTQPDPNTWMIDITNDGKPVTFNELEHTDDADLTLMDFRNNQGLVPIYKFVSDPVKKEELKRAVEKYLGE